MFKPIQLNITQNIFTYLTLKDFSFNQGAEMKMIFQKLILAETLSVPL